MTESPETITRVSEMRATLKSLREILNASEDPHPVLDEIERALGVNTREAMQAAIVSWCGLSIAERTRLQLFSERTEITGWRYSAAS